MTAVTRWRHNDLRLTAPSRSLTDLVRRTDCVVLRAEDQRARTSKFDASEAITSELIRVIERGVLPWRKPWTAGAASRPLRHSGEPYQGINNFLLTMRTQLAGYA